MKSMCRIKTRLSSLWVKCKAQACMHTHTVDHGRCQMPCWYGMQFFLPWPEIHISDKEVSHHPLQLAETIGEWLRGIRESLDKSSLQASAEKWKTTHAAVVLFYEKITSIVIVNMYLTSHYKLYYLYIIYLVVLSVQPENECFCRGVCHPINKRYTL